MSGIVRAIGAMVAVLALFVAVAQVARADAVEDATRRIGKQLQCPVCSGASVADSPSDLAGQMRSVIRAKVQAGESDDEIIGYFVERYGDGILIEPPRRGIGLVVWLMPVAILVVGSFLLWRLVRGWLQPRWAPLAAPSTPPAVPHRNGTAHHDDDPPSSVDRARAELDRFRKGR
ncbi:MAG: cytochrome c-type biogenesis protein CcmH [Chloroflexota bacterium]